MSVIRSTKRDIIENSRSVPAITPVRAVLILLSAIILVFALWAHRVQSINDQLVIGIMEVDPNSVSKALDAGADPNKRLPRTAGHGGGVVTKLVRFASLGKMSMEMGSRTVLMRAASMGNIRIVHLLLEHGAAPDIISKRGSSALLLAASKPDSAVVAELLTHGSNANQQDPIGMTPLMLAAIGGHPDSLNCLITSHADPLKRDLDGYTALMHAVENRRKDNVVALASNKACVEQIHKIVTQPIEWAAGNNNTELTLQFWEMSSDADRRAQLDGALSQACANGNLELIEFFLSNGASPNGGNKGESPLNTAIEYAQPKAINSLIEANVDVNREDSEGNIPINNAASVGDVSMVERLLSVGASPFAKVKKTGQTLLHNAVGNLDLTRIALSHKIPVDVRDNAHQTPLMLATDPKAAFLLIENGASLTAIDEMGRTALMRAIDSEKPGVVAVLLWKGANVKVKDSSGRDASAYARSAHSDHITRLLDGTITVERNARQFINIGTGPFSQPPRYVSPKVVKAVFKPEYKPKPYTRDPNLPVYPGLALDNSKNAN